MPGDINSFIQQFFFYLNNKKRYEWSVSPLTIQISVEYLYIFLNNQQPMKINRKRRFFFCLFRDYKLFSDQLNRTDYFFKCVFSSIELNRGKRLLLFHCFIIESSELNRKKNKIISNDWVFLFIFYIFFFVINIYIYIYARDKSCWEEIYARFKVLILSSFQRI